MWSSNDRAELIRLEKGKDKGVLSEHSGKKIEKDRWYELKVVVSSMKNECYLDNEPVSYTHLDVYKRQGLIRVFILRLTM